MTKRSLAHQVGQMLMGGFEGTVAPDYLLNWLSEGRLGGVILFARNVESPQQLAKLTQSLHDAAMYPLLISVDQEGGTVARLREGFAQSPGAMALASVRHNSVHVTEQVSAVLGREMAALGINWTYAPVVDITYNAENPTVGTRSFGTDPEHIAAHAAAAVRGFQHEGVVACAKHFPGLGNTAVDTHLALPSLATTADELIAHDLIPYRAAMESGLATIMTTHTIFTALDPQHPGPLSSAVIGGLLRGRLGFGGVVTTDCMEMKAIDDHYGVPEGITQAVRAGVDIVLYSHTPDKQREAFDALLDAAESDTALQEKIAQANARIDALKSQFPAQPINIDSIRSADHLTTVRQAARATVASVKGTSTQPLPIQPDDSRYVVLVEFNPGLDSEVQERVHSTYLITLIHEKFPNVTTVALPAEPSAEQVDSVPSNADVLILATRNAHLHPPQADAVQSLAATAQSVVLVALRNPYDAALIDMGTVYATSGDSEPSLEAIVDLLTGELSADGVLPVPVGE